MKNRDDRIPGYHNAVNNNLNKINFSLLTLNRTVFFTTFKTFNNWFIQSHINDIFFLKEHQINEWNWCSKILTCSRRFHFAECRHLDHSRNLSDQNVWHSKLFFMAISINGYIEVGLNTETEIYHISDNFSNFRYDRLIEHTLLKHLSKF